MIIHILLLILRICGFILLLLLALLLLILLLTLFVPIRYRIRVVKEPALTEAEGRISYLLRLVQLLVLYREQEAEISFRIAGRPLRQIRKSFRREKSGAKSEPPAGTGKEEDDKRISPEETDHNKDNGHRSEQRERQEPIRREKDNQVQIRPAGRDEPSGTSGSPDQEAHRSKNISQSVIALISSIPERLMNGILKLFDVLENGTDRADELLAGAEGLKDRTSFLFDAETEHLVRLLFRSGKKMLRHFRPRQVQGYLHYGFDRPDLTAKCGGLLYCILPAGAKHFDIQPDWEETVFACSMTVSGHVRLCHVVFLALKLLLKRDTWRLIKKLRKKKTGKNKTQPV